MKKPKRFITNTDLSKMVVDVCVFLGAICGIYIISDATSLSIVFKVVDMFFLFGIAVIFGTEFIIVCLDIKRRKEKADFEAEENEDEEK